MKPTLQFKGFTLINMLVALTILAILVVGSIRYYIKDFLPASQNVDRVQALNTMKKGLTLYYQQHGHYPPASGASSFGFADTKPNCTSNISSTKKDNAFSEPGIIEYLGSYAKEWQDPLVEQTTIAEGGDLYNEWNCRYVIPETLYDCDCTINYGLQTGQQASGCNSGECGNGNWWDANYPQYEVRCTDSDCAHPNTYKEIQKYNVHCFLAPGSDVAANDGGLNPDLYEVFEPDPWLCPVMMCATNSDCVGQWGDTCCSNFTCLPFGLCP